jgi:hypothetical protein
MDKIKQLSEALFENDLVKSNDLINQIIAIKIQEKLQEKKIQIASIMLATEEEEVTEQENTRVISMRRHIRSAHPHLAREKNLANRQKFDRNVDSNARKSMFKIKGT